MTILEIHSNYSSNTPTFTIARFAQYEINRVDGEGFSINPTKGKAYDSRSGVARKAVDCPAVCLTIGLILFRPLDLGVDRIYDVGWEIDLHRGLESVPSIALEELTRVVPVSIAQSKAVLGIA